MRKSGASQLLRRKTRGLKKFELFFRRGLRNFLEELQYPFGRWGEKHRERTLLHCPTGGSWTGPGMVSRSSDSGRGISLLA